MFYKDLYTRILLEPIDQGADELLIVTGYSSAALIERHLREPKIARRMLPVNMVLGMTRSEGLPVQDHHKILELSKSSQKQSHDTKPKTRTGRLECRYITGLPDVHAKIYVWLENKHPIVAFTGSANYSHAGFNEKERVEVMDFCDAAEAYLFYREIASRAVLCTDEDSTGGITLYDYSKNGRTEFNNLDQVDIPLWNPKKGEIEEKSGLNWGFAKPRSPGNPRDTTEAYIPIYGEMVHSDFFPQRPATFTIITDDENEIYASKGQGSAEGKGLSTPMDNTVFGKYFRSRLGVAWTQRLKRADFEKYGRTEVRFSKIDDDTFHMDFSQPEY